MSNLFSMIFNSLCLEKPTGGGEYSYSRSILRNNCGSVFDYDFMMSLEEKDYAKYLSRAYYIKTLMKLNLRNPKTFNEKIQWLKLFDNKPNRKKSELTDKVLVRDWVKKQIGEEYLKPVLWIGDKFDDIPFTSLYNSFIVKCNHGCKWHFIIKKKEEFLNNSHLFNFTKIKIDNWMKQSFFGWSDFETQYKPIVPKIIIEKLLFNKKGTKKIRNWCFNGSPEFTQVIQNDDMLNFQYAATFDINLNNINVSLDSQFKHLDISADNIVEKSVELSKILAKNFKLVRVDWMVWDGKLYFEEMTFTPYSGFLDIDYDLQMKLGKLLNLKGD